MVEVHVTTDYPWHSAVVRLHFEIPYSSLLARLTEGFREQLTALAARRLPSQSACSLEAVLPEPLSMSYGSECMHPVQQQGAPDR